MMGNDDMRFSDGELHQFHQDFRDHEKSEQEWRKMQDERWTHQDDRWDQQQMMWSEIMDALSATVKSQQTNTDAIAVVVAETRDLVRLQRDVKGVVRLGSRAQAFTVWLLKWGAIGAGLAAVVKYMTDFFNP